MKIFTTVLISLFYNLVFPQTPIEGKSFIINTANNYSFLENVIKSKKIVLLGEQSHGDGATFDEKVEIVKYLHEKMGYNTIVFESGFYDHYKAFKQYSENKSNISIFSEAVFGIWSDTKAFQNLMDYVNERAKQNDPIKILGFDSQEGSIFKNHYMDDLIKLFQNRKITFPENVIISIEKSFVSRDLEDVASNKKDSLELYKNFDFVMNSFNKIENVNFDEKIMKQVFISKIADVSFDIMQLQKQKIAVQNPRDEQMAKNLIFLSEIYPNDKMICWGASYHFSKKINQFEYTDETEDYFKQYANNEIKNTGYTDYKTGDGSKLLEGAIPMGELLKKHFGEQIYSIAFSSYEGEYGIVDEKPFPILQPPFNSIEHQLYDKATSKTFFEFNKNDNNSYYCSALGNIPFKAKWGFIFDGLLFIKKSYQPEIRSYPKPVINNSKEEVFSIVGKIIDSKNRKVIPNAEVSLVKTKRSIVANKDGAFSFTIQKKDFQDKLIISAMGYATDTINISSIISTNKNQINIRLRSHKFEGIILDEVVVNSARKSLTAEDIVTKARNNIELNYYQDPYNQKFYFRTQIIKKNKITSNIEAVINTYNSNGMKGVNTPDEELYGEIQQMRTLAEDNINNQYGKITNFAFIFDRDVILSKSNVLYKTSSYNLKKEEVLLYNDRKVYKISFVNNSPGSYSTGYGYPAPKKSSGILYIDTETFAVLKYEHCVVREPSEIKNEKDKMAQMLHKIIFTYKIHEGKYFINYCNVINKSIITSIADNVILSENFLVNNVMSIDVKYSNVEKIERHLQKINQNITLKEDSKFWNNNNFILQDDKVIFDLCD
ncbi:erythromycin esterase family protein [Flavobacterium sp. XS1P32]|uniref:erythromycin esterase family protein n=1 Tax=Flavobacterium sp. XS1P32 TaxID=3401726 RepID=UPI003AADF800